MFCLLAVFIYLFVVVSKKGCQCSSPVKRKDNCISVKFLYNSKVCMRLPKKLQIGKNMQFFFQIALFSSERSAESL